MCLYASLCVCVCVQLSKHSLSNNYNNGLLTPANTQNDGWLLYVIKYGVWSKCSVVFKCQVFNRTLQRSSRQRLEVCNLSKVFNFKELIFGLLG